MLMVVQPKKNLQIFSINNRVYGPCFNLIIMLHRRINKLEAEKADILERLDNIHDTDADPNYKAIYQCDLQYRLVCVEDEIDSERTLMPFKYMLVGFVIAVVSILVYFINQQ